MATLHPFFAAPGATGSPDIHWVLIVLLVLAAGAAGTLLLIKPPRPIPPVEEDEDPFTFP